MGQILTEQQVLAREILSPSNRKIEDYKTVPGLQEIVLVQSQTMQVEISRRGLQGWPGQPDIVQLGGMARLDSIGFSCPIVAIYAGTSLATTPRPPPPARP